MSEPILEIVRDGHVGRIWLNRPHRHNAITMEMIDLFEQAFSELERDDHIRAVVLRGRGGTFCSGFDLDALQADPLGQKARSERVARVFDRFHGISKPTFAVLEGYVTGGGFEFMIACDFAIAAEDARSVTSTSAGACSAAPARAIGCRDSSGCDAPRSCCSRAGC